MTRRGQQPTEPPDDDFPDQVPQGAITVMQGGASIVKAENETLTEYAIRYPRNPAAALAQALAELDLDPAFASKQWYSIPYKITGDASGQAVCPCEGKRAGHPREPHTNVEGVSIKGARACARAWGNCGVKVRVVDENDERIMVEALAIDRQTGFTVSREGAVSKFMRFRNGQVVSIPSHKLPQQIGIVQSKMERNALLAIVPESFVRRFWARARELAEKVVDGAAPAGAKKGGGLIAAFGPFLDPKPDGAPKGWTPDWDKVRARLEKSVGCKLSKMTDEQKQDLLGVLNALENGESSADDCFPPADAAGEAAAPEPEAPPAAAPASGPLPNGRFQHTDGTQSPVGERCGQPLCACAKVPPPDPLRGRRMDR